MLASDDPGQLTPEERFDEVAKILARGLLRSKKSADLTANRGDPAATAQNSSESGTAGLEVFGETRLSVRAGRRFPRTPTRSTAWT
jgi:hypothetical protein